MTGRVLVLAVVMAGCAPIDGSTCEEEAATQCDGARVAYCERASLGGLKWKAYDCPSGCDSLKARKCDWNGVDAGAACPANQASQANCPGDGRLMLCLSADDGGVWVDAPCERCVAGAPTSSVLNCNGISCACR
jgi:hypothetical protein